MVLADGGLFLDIAASFAALVQVFAQKALLAALHRSSCDRKRILYFAKGS
jgi:hypothetical protein